MQVSDFQILIKSCSIEYRNDQSPKSEVAHETKFSLKISYSPHASHVLSRHVLQVSDFQILIKSCSIEYRNDQSPKSEVAQETKFSLKISYSPHACLAQLDRHQTCKAVTVSVVSSSPTGGNFIFLRHLDANFVQKCQKCQIYVIYENLDCLC